MNAILVTLIGSAPTDTGPGAGGPGIVAFGIVVALGVVCWLLYRSLRTHLGRVRFDEGTPTRKVTPRGPWRPGQPWPTDAPAPPPAAGTEPTSEGGSTPST